MPTKPITLVAAKTLLVHQHRALLVRRSESDPSSPGTWELPGGKLEYGETPQQAALRELKEETGIDGTLGPILYADSIMGIRSNRQYIVLVYFATTDNPAVTLSFEHADYLWATQTQMRQMLTKHQLAMLEEYEIWDNPLIGIQ